MSTPKDNVLFLMFDGEKKIHLEARGSNATHIEYCDDLAG